MKDQFFNQYTTQAVESPQWEMTEDGFARCKAKIMKEGILLYARSEFVDEQGNCTIPPEVTADPIRMLVTADTLQAAESVRSLEGAHCTHGDHKWLTPENINADSVGNVAGHPAMDGSHLMCDLLLTSPVTIAQVLDKGNPLGEVSAAYRADALWESGVWDGQPYDAKQVQLRYNHIAIIGAGEGRAGSSVRILNMKPETNVKEKKKMADEKPIVRVKLRNGRFINTDDEGAAAIADDTGAAETSEAESSKTVEQLIEEMSAKNEELAALQGEVEELKGQLETFKSKIDELLSEGGLEEVAEEMNVEQEEAGEVIANMSPEEDEKKQEEFKNSLKKMHGTKLHTAVLTHLGMKVENMSPDTLRGAFMANVQIARMKGGKKGVVAGSGIFQNRTDVVVTPPKQRTGHERLGLRK